MVRSFGVEAGAHLLGDTVFLTVQFVAVVARLYAKVKFPIFGHGSPPA